MYPIPCNNIPLWLVLTVGNLVIKPRAVKHMVAILISSGCKVSRSEPDL